MLVSEKTYTIAEYEEYAAAYPDKLLELIDGRIVEKVTSEEHGYIVITIGSELRSWKKRTGAKGYFSSESSHRIQKNQKDERRPDVSFRYTDDSVSSETALYEMPDFAVEVKSIGNSYDELRDKARFYLANGSRLVWLVYPNRRIVEVYFEDGTSELFKEEYTLSGGDVLPDFEMKIADIFDM
jgi:Uma2 family endonuclease